MASLEDFGKRPGARARVAAVASLLVLALGACRATSGEPSATLAPATAATGPLVAEVAIAASPPGRAEAAPARASGPALPAAEPATRVASSAVPWKLPADWDRMSLFRFESALDAWFPGGTEKRSLAPETVRELARALDRKDDGAVRAALLLARSGDPAAGGSLLVHLEGRLERSDEDGGDAADVVAAAAFETTALGEGRDAAARLEALATSARPHPDLEVRVECARSALLLGRDGVIPFLLLVLREGTSAARPVPVWKRTPDFAWAQMRAADALSRRAGVPVAYRPEASIAEREAEAARLERLLPKPRKKKK